MDWAPQLLEQWRHGYQNPLMWRVLFKQTSTYSSHGFSTSLQNKVTKSIWLDLFNESVWKQSITEQHPWPVCWVQWCPLLLWGDVLHTHRECTSQNSVWYSHRVLFIHPTPSPIGEYRSPWVQVVQAVLVFHVDQGDPGTDTGEKCEIAVHCCQQLNLRWVQNSYMFHSNVK